MGPVARWDLFWADLDPAVGSQQGGARRPVLVVSNNGFNARLSLVTVLPCTKLAGKRRQVYPFEVLLAKGVVTADQDSILMPQQIRTIAKSRLLERIGAIADGALRTEIENRMLEHLDITFKAEITE